MKSDVATNIVIDPVLHTSAMAYIDNIDRKSVV